MVFSCAVEVACYGQPEFSVFVSRMNNNIDCAPMRVALRPILPGDANRAILIVFASAARTPRDSLTPFLRASTTGEMEGVVLGRHQSKCHLLAVHYPSYALFIRSFRRTSSQSPPVDSASSMLSVNSLRCRAYPSRSLVHCSVTMD